MLKKISDFKSNKTLNELSPGDKSINIMIIIIELIEKMNVKNGKNLTKYLVADPTGCISCVFFDDICDKIKEGDIIFINGGYATLFKKHLTLYTPQVGYGNVTKLGSYFMEFETKPNFSDKEYN